MLQNQQVVSYITTNDQTVHGMLAGNHSTPLSSLKFAENGYVSLSRHCDVKMSRKSCKHLFFFFSICFSTRKCLFDTFTKNCTRNCTAAYT